MVPEMTRKVFTFVFLAGFLPLLLDSKFTSRQPKWNRSRRQAPIGILNPPIPTSIAHFVGSNQVIDSCPRDEVLMPDGNCYSLLTQGPCAITQYILLDPDTNKPYCAERLCAPDRIFIFSDQLCHDPRNSQLCPPGRQLYETAYGTPICQCPTGTYEGDDDLDDDVCEPLLGMGLVCPPGQVFWFRDFSLPPECLPDPCGGDNLNRGPNDQPFVPYADGRCFQLGSMPSVCPAQTWYTIAMERLQGVCTSLEDAGYQVFDSDTLAQLNEIYGPPIARERTSPIPVPSSGSAAGQIPVAGTGGMTPSSGTPTTGGNQGTLGTGAPGAFNQGTFNGGAGASGPGTFNQGSGGVNQGTFNGGAGAGGPGTFNQGSGGVNQGTFNGGAGASGPGTFNQETFNGGAGVGGPGTFNQETFNGGAGAGGPGAFNQGTFNGGAGAGGPGTFNQGSGGGNQGTFNGGAVTANQGSGNSGQGFGFNNQGPFGGGAGNGVSGSGIQGTFSQGGGSSIGDQGIFNGRAGSQGVSGGGFGVGGQGMSTHGINAGNQGTIGGGAGIGSHGFGSGGQSGGGRPITFPESISGLGGVSSRPVSPFMSNTGGGTSSSFPGSSSLMISQGHPIAVFNDDQSREHLGMYDDEEPSFRTPGHDSQIESVIGDVGEIHISEGQLLAGIDVTSAGLSLPGSRDNDVELLQAPPGHELHGFFNSVRTLVHHGPHNRSRRSPLPHAAPGNVIETRLVGCRAGAQRDLNAKCRNTVLPSRTPASRPARAAPPVPPSPGCPSGQSFNVRRMCEPSGSAINSINRFNLG